MLVWLFFIHICLFDDNIWSIRALVVIHLVFQLDMYDNVFLFVQINNYLKKTKTYVYIIIYTEHLFSLHAWME